MQQTELNAQMIDKHLEAIRQQVQQFQNLPPTSQNKNLLEKRINQEFKILQNEMDIFELDESTLVANNQTTVLVKYQALKQDRNKLIREFKSKAEEIQVTQQQEEQRVYENRELLVQRVDQKIQQAQVGLDECIINLSEG